MTDRRVSEVLYREDLSLSAMGLYAMLAFNGPQYHDGKWHPDLPSAAAELVVAGLANVSDRMGMISVADEGQRPDEH